MVLSSILMTYNHCESLPGSRDECRAAPGGCRPWGTKSTNLGCKKLHPPSYITIVRLLNHRNKIQYATPFWDRWRLYHDTMISAYRIIRAHNAFSIKSLLSFIFTAQCTLVQMRGLGIACRMSVCPSVCNVGGL